MNHSAFLKLLHDQLQSFQARNSAYSVRAFAKKIDLAVGTVSEVLAGKRQLAPKSVKKVLDRLEILPRERTKILKSPHQKLSYEHTQLQADQYAVLSEWYYFGILNLIRTQDFVHTPLHISKRLGISLSIARQAIERLERLKLISIENGRMKRTSVALQTTDGIPDSAIRKSHHQSLDRSRLAMENHPFGTFDLAMMTFAFDSEDMNAAKQKIREFQDEFAEQFSVSKKANEVYRLAIQLFALTEPSNPSGKKHES